jgi:hypothetical protein
MVISVGEKAAGVLIFTGVVAPLVGLLLRRMGDAWGSVGGGPFAILRTEEPKSGRGKGAPAALDPAIQAAEVRQMLEAKAARQKQRGGPEIDVEAESERLLAVAAEGPSGGKDEALRAEVRSFVLARNERRRRQGLEPLDVAAETERQLADLGG